MTNGCNLRVVRYLFESNWMVHVSAREVCSGNHVDCYNFTFKSHLQPNDYLHILKYQCSRRCLSLARDDSCRSKSRFVAPNMMYTVGQNRLSFINLESLGRSNRSEQHLAVDPLIFYQRMCSSLGQRPPSAGERRWTMPHSGFTAALFSLFQTPFFIVM